MRKRAYLPPLVAALVSSCLHLTPKPALDNWQAVISSYARHYDEVMGSSDEFRVVPARGFEFPVGTALRPDTASAITDVCVWTQAIPEHTMIPTPSITTGRQFLFSASLPDKIKIALGSVLDLSAAFSSSGTAAISFQNEKGFLLTEEQVSAILQDQRCADALHGRTVQIVRGYISAQQLSESKAGIDANLNVTVENAGLTIKYNTNNDWSVKDALPHRYFLIVSSIKFNPVLVESAPTLPAVESSPDRARTEFSFSRPEAADLLRVGLAP